MVAICFSCQWTQISWNVHTHSHTQQQHISREKKVLYIALVWKTRHEALTKSETPSSSSPPSKYELGLSLTSGMKRNGYGLLEPKAPSKHISPFLNRSSRSFLHFAMSGSRMLHEGCVMKGFSAIWQTFGNNMRKRAFTCTKTIAGRVGAKSFYGTSGTHPRSFAVETSEHHSAGCNSCAV